MMKIPKKKERDKKSLRLREDVLMEDGTTMISADLDRSGVKREPL